MGCAARTPSDDLVSSPNGRIIVKFALDAGQSPVYRVDYDGQPVNPSSTLPWLTPWRLIAIGSLGTIAESTLGVDLADKPAVQVPGTIRPGKASWSWPLIAGAAEAGQAGPSR